MACANCLVRFRVHAGEQVDVDGYRVQAADLAGYPCLTPTQCAPTPEQVAAITRQNERLRSRTLSEPEPAVVHHSSEPDPVSMDFSIPDFSSDTGSSSGGDYSGDGGASGGGGSSMDY